MQTRGFSAGGADGGHALVPKRVFEMEWLEVICKLGESFARQGHFLAPNIPSSSPPDLIEWCDGMAIPPPT